MKALGIILTIITMSSFSFADPVSVFVKRNQVQAGVTAQQNEAVKMGLRKAVTESGDKLARSAEQAEMNLQGKVSKDGTTFTLTVEETKNGATVTSEEATVDDVTQLGSTAQSLATHILSNAEKPAAAMSKPTVETAVVTPDPGQEKQSAATPANCPPPPVNDVEARHPNYIKHWYVGLGPVVTNTLLGTNGTKYNVDLAYNQGMSERIDMLYFYDGSFNTASQGSTAVTEVGVGASFFISDRGADSSPFLRLDLGYGGNNRGYDAGPMGGAGVGWDFFRTKDVTFEVLVRVFALYTGPGATLTNIPNDTEVRIGIYF